MTSILPNTVRDARLHIGLNVTAGCPLQIKILIKNAENQVNLTNLQTVYQPVSNFKIMKRKRNQTKNVTYRRYKILNRKYDFKPVDEAPT